MRIGSFVKWTRARKRPWSPDAASAPAARSLSASRIARAGSGSCPWPKFQVFREPNTLPGPVRARQVARYGLINCSPPVWRD